VVSYHSVTIKAEMTRKPRDSAEKEKANAAGPGQGAREGGKKGGAPFYKIVRHRQRKGNFRKGDGERERYEDVIGIHEQPK